MQNENTCEIFYFIAADLSLIKHGVKPESLVVPQSPFAFMCDDVNDLSSALNQATPVLQFYISV